MEPESTLNTKSDAAKFNYWKGDFISIGRQLASVNWQTELKNKTTEESWQYFRDTIMELVSKYVPKRHMLRR